MKILQLEEVEMAGNQNLLNRRCFANGKRVSNEEFRSIKNSATSLDCFNTVNKGGNYHYYCCARIQAIAVLPVA